MHPHCNSAAQSFFRGEFSHADLCGNFHNKIWASSTPFLGFFVLFWQPVIMVSMKRFHHGSSKDDERNMLKTHLKAPTRLRSGRRECKDQKRKSLALDSFGVMSPVSAVYGCLTILTVKSKWLKCPNWPLTPHHASSTSTISISTLHWFWQRSHVSTWRWQGLALRPGICHFGMRKCCETFFGFSIFIVWCIYTLYNYI